jgi:parvulin-like peptidyl-prolyl isomerase
MTAYRFSPRRTPLGLRRERPARVLLMALLLAATGCQAGTPPPPAPDVVAQIEGDAVRYPDFQTYLQQALGESGSSLSSDVLSSLLDQYLDERLLSRLAVERGLLPEDAADGRFGRRRALDLLLADEARREGDDARPTEAEVKAWYLAHLDELRRPERVRLRQILVETRQQAEKLRARIEAGGDFGAVGAAAAADPDVAATAGFQGELSRADLPPAFADLIFSLQPGEVSDVVEAEYGFHLFEVTERLPAETLPLEAVRDDVERRLLQDAADRRLTTLAEEARRRYDVSVWDRNLPFNYRGVYGDQGG